MSTATPSTSGSLRRSCPVIGLFAVVAIVALLLLPTAFAPPGSGAAQRASTVTASASGAAGTNPYVCAFNTTPDSSDRDVRLAPPSFSLASGDSLTATFEFEVVRSSTSPIDLALTVPSLFAKFPLSNGTDLTSYFAPRTITLTNTLWSNGSLATKTKTMSGATPFSGSSAYMTSELLAIMANASYQTVSLAFRWDWSVVFAGNGTGVTSPWSRVVTTGPSANTFYPAPYVSLASKSNTTVDIGAEFTAYLSGAISDTAFHSVLENASTGNVVINTPTDTTSGASPPVAVSVQILPPNQSLGPGALLDHVRNVCGALLYSISLKAVYAPTATVTLAVAPTTCGPITFDGTSYASGAVVNVTPSSTALPIHVAACASDTFLGWSRTEGAWVTTRSALSTSATISSSGTLTARFS
ncbi:MAG: hypothetical protein L3K17_03490 [Thermoplasmata archaeon]|nr:hypothetical protein [Thermoplasmata archaeon]